MATWQDFVNPDGLDLDEGDIQELEAIAEDITHLERMQQPSGTYALEKFQGFLDKYARRQYELAKSRKWQAERDAMRAKGIEPPQIVMPRPDKW